MIKIIALDKKTRNEGTTVVYKKKLFYCHSRQSDTSRDATGSTSSAIKRVSNMAQYSRQFSVARAGFRARWRTEEER